MDRKATRNYDREKGQHEKCKLKENWEEGGRNINTSWKTGGGVKSKPLLHPTFSHLVLFPQNNRCHQSFCFGLLGNVLSPSPQKRKKR